MVTYSTEKKLAEQILADLKSSIGAGSGAQWTIPLDDFHLLKFPWRRQVDLPALFVGYLDQTEENTGTNASDDVGFRCLVRIAQTSNRDLASDDDRILYWREVAAATFRRKTLTVGSIFFHKCVIEPRPILDPGLFAINYDASDFVVRAITRLQRS